MAKPPLTVAELMEHFGPHLNYTPPGGWQDESRHAAERLVKTHCCFCGQQCGIQLKVRENKVVGFPSGRAQCASSQSIAGRCSGCSRPWKIALLPRIADR